MATNYRARVERALRYIAEHRAEPLRLANVARAAQLSEFHFHRIFASVMGESVGRFIARSRLEHAALRLAYEPDRSITEIALESGYSSPSNFSKAFSAHFGCAPSRVRRREGALPRAVGKLVRGSRAPLDPAALHALPPQASAAERRRRYAALSKHARFERCEALDLACLASPAGYDFAAQGATWEELIERARQLGIADAGIDAYGLAYDSPRLTAPELCRYHACVPCPPEVPLPAPLFRGRIPAGRYAVFPYAGPVAGIEEMYRAIYSIWLPESSLAPDAFVAVDHYVNDWPVGGEIDLEIRIKVRAR